MAKLFLASVLIVSMVGSAHMQNPNGQGGQGLGGLLGGLGNLGGMLGMQQGGQAQPSLLPQMDMMGGQNSMNSGGLGQTLSQLPRAGMQALQNLLNGVRNMLPLGQQRQMGNQSGLFNGMQNPMNGMQNPMNSLQNPMNGLQNRMNGMQNPMSSVGPNPFNQLTNLQLPEPLGSLTRPITDGLRQGNLPNLSSLTQNLGSTASQLTNSLQGTLSQALPTNGQAGPLSNLLGGGVRAS